MPRTGARFELMAGSWTDITTDVFHRNVVTISRGRQDVQTRVDPGTCNLTINNKGGTYSPRNPVSPLYGAIGRNTPMRVSVLGGPVRLRLDGSSSANASTPHVSALDITGDLDVRVEAVGDWRNTAPQTLAGRWGATIAASSWLLRVAGNQIIFNWVDGAGTAWFVQQLVPDTAGRHAAFRATLDVNNGAGGSTATLWWAPTISDPWTSIATFSPAATLSLQAGTADLVIGPNVSGLGAPLTGSVYAAEVRSGIDGTIIASPTFTAQPAGVTSFTDPAGRVWSTHGAAVIDNRSTRFVGEMTSWPSRWDVSGGDVYVPAQAKGILRRLGQGVDPLQSTLRRRIPSDPNLIAYWPMEDASGSTQGYSPLPGVRPMRTTGFQFASDDSLAGSSALPELTTPSTMIAPVPAAPAGDWRVEMVYRVDTVPALPSLVAQVNLAGSTAASVRFYVGVGVSRITVVDASGATLNTFDFTLNNFTDNWGRIQIFTSTSGSTVTATAQWVVIGAPANWQVSTSFTGTPGRVASVAGTWASDFTGFRIGHIAVFKTPSTSIFDNADIGFDGETGDTRALRLSAEEGVPLLTPFGRGGDTPMGPQRPDTLVNLMQDVADADSGILYEARHAVALAIRPRTSLYNQPVALTLDYSARGEVAPPLEPDTDDQTVRNDVTRSRPSGSSARVTLDAGTLSTQAPPLGVGRYPDTQTINVHSDDQLPDAAGWWLHVGTWDEDRYPAVTVSLTAAPWLVDAVCAVDVGDRIQITNPPPWLAPGVIDLIVQGYSESIGWADWTITFNCTPAGPWTVGVLDDPVLGRADTDGSQLAAGVNGAATALSVAVTAGPLWVTTAGNPAEFPFDILVGGEVMTVTGITGAASPQTFTVVRSVNGVHKTQSAGTDVRLANPMIAAL